MKTKLFFEFNKPHYGKNEDFWVNVLLDTNNQSVNAIGGSVQVDSIFTIKDIKESDSNIVFWMDAPMNENNTISFSGIIPGGINLSKTRILSILLHAKESGVGNIYANNISVLQNNGSGSILENTVIPARIQISSDVVNNTLDITDTEKPEAFIPLISKDDGLFEGKNFIVFSTHDKLSGVKEYQIKEGFWGTFIAVESPYELKYQRLDHTIYIKAVDKKGNERVATVPAQHMSSLEIGIILIIGLLGMVLLVSKIWKRIS